MIEGLSAQTALWASKFAETPGGDAWSSIPPMWTNVLGSYFVWAQQEVTREKEALTPFNRVVFVHAKTRRPLRMSRTKAVRCRKIWNKRRREVRQRVSRRKRLAAAFLYAPLDFTTLGGTT